MEIRHPNLTYLIGKKDKQMKDNTLEYTSYKGEKQ